MMMESLEMQLIHEMLFALLGFEGKCFQRLEEDRQKNGVHEKNQLVEESSIVSEERNYENEEWICEGTVTMKVSDTLKEMTKVEREVINSLISSGGQYVMLERFISYFNSHLPILPDNVRLASGTFGIRLSSLLFNTRRS